MKGLASGRFLPRRAWIALLGMFVSVGLHVVTALAVAFSPWPFADDAPIAPLEFTGRRGVVQIEASFTMPTPDEPVVAIPLHEPSMVVTPQAARMDQRTYVQQHVASADFSAEFDAASIQPMASPLPITRPSFNATPLAESVTPQIPPIPRAVSTPPVTAGLETAASFSGNPPPVYPAVAVQNGWRGSVLLKLQIDATGTVTSVSVERSSGHEVLDAAAVNAVRQWRGTPKRVSGKAAASVELQEIKFRPR